MSESESSSDTADNQFGHDYSKHYRSPEGYGVCCDCGARENTIRSAQKCARLVFPVRDWEVSRRMIEDRARAELRQELAAASDDSSDEIVEGAEYWIIDPRLVIPPVLACVQDLMTSRVVHFTIGNEQRGYRDHTRRRSTFNLMRKLAAVIRSHNGATGKEPR